MGTLEFLNIHPLRGFFKFFPEKNLNLKGKRVRNFSEAPHPPRPTGIT